VTLDVDADRGATFAEEFIPRQRVSDQQDVLYAGVKRSGHFTEQQSGGLGIQ
jgi:hypothetical protein